MEKEVDRQLDPVVPTPEATIPPTTDQAVAVQVEPDTQTPPRSRNKIFLIFILSLAIFSLAVGLAWFFNSSDQTPTQELAETATVELADEADELVYLDQIDFQEQTPVWDRLELTAEPYTYEIEFFQIGSIEQTPYRGDELILAKVFAHGPGKGPQALEPIYERFIHHKDQLIFLPMISRGTQSVLENQPEILSEFGLRLATNDLVTITQLETPESLVMASPEQEIQFHLEVETEWFEDQVELVYDHPDYGSVYTTRAELSDQETFYLSDEEVEDVGIFGKLCPGPRCLLTNGFFLPRPDGTVGVYRYDFAQESRFMNQIEVEDALYTYYTRYGCSEAGVDFAARVFPPVDTTELTPTSTWGPDEVTVYSLTEDHQLIDQFYAKYQLIYQEDISTRYGLEPMLSRDEFVDSNPVLLAEDPFGRQIRLLRSDLLPPLACEPIIYLYAPEPTEISLRFGSSVRILESDPEYSDGWRVRADETGEIVDLRDGSTHPYLFWEGQSHLLPRLERGAVLSRAEVSGFLDQSLSKLGLVGSEIDDFKYYWLDKLTQSPYVAISFYDQAVVDAVYPIEITPDPDTSIRVLMDYQLLRTRIDLPPQNLPANPPQRQGVTLVEWGGLER